MHRNNEIRKARRGTATGHAKIQTSLNEMVGGVRAAITTTAAALVNPSCAAAECALSLSLHSATGPPSKYIYTVRWHYKSARRAGSALLVHDSIVLVRDRASAHDVLDKYVHIVLTRRGRLRRSFRFLSQFFDFDCTLLLFSSPLISCVSSLVLQAATCDTYSRIEMKPHRWTIR